MARCLLALGSNLGDRQTILADVCAALAQMPDTLLLTRSHWYATAPIGGAAGQGEFLNGAVLLETSLTPQQLASALQEIEARLGRQRIERWDARTIDIDILLYGEQVIDTPGLIVPHPRMSFRSFVLEPAAEIAGAMLHPTSGWTLARLLSHLRTSPRLVIVTAAEPSIADWLVSQLRLSYSSSQMPEIHDQPAQSSDFTTAGELQCPASQSGQPPVIASRSPAELQRLSTALLSQECTVRPALVIALDAKESHNLLSAAQSAGFPPNSSEASSVTAVWWKLSGIGPLARITVDDPATVLQESQAALRCIWPDLQQTSTTII